MANRFFDSFLNGILGAHATYVDLDADTIKMSLHDEGVGGVPNAATHDFWNDLSAGLVGTAYTLANKSIGTSNGAGSFDNTVDPAPAFSTVSGATVEGLVFWKDTTVDTTSNLICYFDTATGLPLTPNGGDVNVTFHANGILKV